MARQALRPADIRLETQPATIGRATRSPEYNFAGTALKEYTLIPTFFAPVLAGDTVFKASVQARSIMPLQNFARVQGAWFEHWLFYVRIGDMDAGDGYGADNIRGTLMSPQLGGYTFDWRQMCMNAIWKNYFVDQAFVEEDSANGVWSPNKYLRNPRTGWWDSAREYGGAYIDPVSDPDNWDGQWAMYQQMRRAGLTTNTWEEYLAKQGVGVGPQISPDSATSPNLRDTKFQIPELVHYSREFVYPQVSMAPSSGGSISPASTLQWFINDKLPRSRFCAEPGFFVGAMAIRSKVYTKTLGSGATTVGSSYDPLTLLNTAAGWLPIDFDTDPHTALVRVEGDYFPGNDTVGTDHEVIDLREQFQYGADEWMQDTVRNSAGVDTLIPTVLMNPPAGSPPTSTPSVFTADCHYRLGVKSRVTKDVTR